MELRLRFASYSQPYRTVRKRSKWSEVVNHCAGRKGGDTLTWNER